MRFLIVAFIFFGYILSPSSCIYAEPKINYLETALLFKEANQYEQAIDVLAALRPQERSQALTRVLFQLYCLNAQAEEALVCFDALKNKQWLDFLYLGLLQEDRAEFDKALISYRNSVDLKPNSIALFRSAKIYHRQKQYKLAADIFSKVISLDSSIRLAYLYRGECLFKSGNYSDAYDSFSRAKNFYPDHRELERNLNEVKEKLGEDFFARRKKETEVKRADIKLPPYQPEKDIPLVRVGLAEALEQFSFACGGPFVVSDGSNVFNGRANVFYTISLNGARLQLRQKNDPDVKKDFSSPLTITSLASSGKLYPFYVLDVKYGESSFWEKKIDRTYRGQLEARLDGKKITLINSLSSEEYLYGVLSAEIPASSPPAALQAQAVAARTIAYRNRGRHARQNFDFCADVHCQVYQGLSAETVATNKAVESTRGQALWHKDKLIESFYHANSGGCLASDVWGKVPYLREKIDAYGSVLPQSLSARQNWFTDEPDTFSTLKNRSSFRWQKVYDSEDFFITFGFSLADVENIIVRDKGECFHVKEIDIVTKSKTYSTKGDLAIRRLFGGLRSSAFIFRSKKDRSGNLSKILLWGAGFGHGSGLSQEGAIAMAEKGYNYQEILKHYYPEAELLNIYPQ